MGVVLVTGGAGFIGSHIVRSLLEQGRSVRVLDNFSSGKRENLAGLAPARLEILEADLRDFARLAQAVQGVEIVFHEAAFVSAPESLDKPQECLDINVSGTAALLESARRAGVRRVVLASSAAVYGDSSELPLQEEGPLQPLSPYGLSKQVDEQLGALYTRSFGLPVVALRYFNVFGPRQRPDSMYAAAVPIFIRCLRDRRSITIFGDGGQTRDLVYVGDVVRANLAAAEHPAAAGQVFNVCTGRETRVLDLVEALSRLLPGGPEPVFEPARPGDIYRSVGSSARAARLLGIKAETGLSAGLQQTLEWMR